MPSPVLFVSYSRADREHVRSLAKDLTALGYSVWFDQEIPGGQAWWDEILTQVLGCRALLFVVSPTSLKSEACESELRYALDARKQVVPVLAKATSASLLPETLRGLNLVDCTVLDKDAVLRLAAALRSLEPPRDLPDPLPDRPPMPVPYLTTLRDRSTKSTLSLDEQRSIVLDFAEYIRGEPEDVEDAEVARELFAAFRKRPDLLARVVRQIDDLPVEVTDGRRDSHERIRRSPRPALRSKRVVIRAFAELSAFSLVALLSAHLARAAGAEVRGARLAFGIVCLAGLIRCARMLRRG